MVKNGSVTQQDVDYAIISTKVLKLGEKTTVALLTLRNGFEVLGTASCVQAANYDHAIGTKLAVQNATDKVWGFLGYALQDKLHEWSGVEAAMAEVSAPAQAYMTKEEYEAAMNTPVEQEFVETQQDEVGETLKDPSAA